MSNEFDNIDNVIFKDLKIDVTDDYYYEINGEKTNYVAYDPANKSESYDIIINKNGYSQNVILGKWDEVLSCTIPNGISDAAYFKVFAYGRDYFRTNTLKVDTRRYNCQVKERRKNATDYLLEKLNTKIDNITFQDNQLKCYSEGKLIDTIFINNIDEVVVRDIIDNHFDEFQQRLEAKLEGYMDEDDIDFLIISL